MAARAVTKNTLVGLSLAGVAAGMIGLAFASVPLYRLFCQVTGYGGTTQVAAAAPEAVGARVFKVRFNADVNGRLPWSFRPEAREVSLRVGEQGMAYYRAENHADETITGTATFNVTPMKVGAYFSKVQCFCFDEQTLAAGEAARLGVTFFVDPAILEDRLLDEVKTITLSYTFFRARDERESAESAIGERRQATANDDKLRVN